MWNTARKIITETFFKDEIEIYRNEVQQDSIGEEFETPVLVGTYGCNLQYEPSMVNNVVSGKDIAQQLRISASPDLSLEYTYTYRIKIKTAQPEFDTGYWRVISWKRTQLGTILTVSREVLV